MGRATGHSAIHLNIETLRRPPLATIRQILTAPTSDAFRGHYHLLILIHRAWRARPVYFSGVWGHLGATTPYRSSVSFGRTDTLARLVTDLASA
jgi:hypothetical protein